jgi:dipeptidyl aminopeptidase/acylaminoacyl peptidase
MGRSLQLLGILSLVACVCVAVGLSSIAVGATDGTATEVERFLKIRTPASPTLLPDGTLLVRDWPDGIWQLYRVTPGKAADGSPSFDPAVSTRVRLTDFADGLSGYTVSPDRRWVVLMHARGGNENTQLTLMDLTAPAGSDVRPVLDNPAVQASVNAWFRDGSGFIYSANDENPSDFHLYRYSIADGKTEKLLARTGSWRAGDATLDKSRVLVEEEFSASDSRVYELNIATGALTELTIAPEGGTASCAIVGYMPDERAVLLRSDIENGLHRLYLKPLAGGKIRQPIPELGAHQLDGAGVNDTRRYLVTSSNEDGFGTLRVFSLPDFKPVTLPAMEKGLVSGSGLRGNTLVWSLNNARTPGAAYATTLDPEKPKAMPVTRQVTWTDDQGLDLASFPLPELIRYPAFDGRQIPAFLFLPPGHASGTAIPFIVYYHGGPESQARPGFNSQLQYLLSRGFGILMPNVRGSTGYGRDFQMMDDYRGRWASVKDGVDAAEWLVKQGYAEPGRIATYGGSYGGFMSVACIVEDQERVERGERPERLFGACVDIVGIVNMKTFLERTSGYRRKLREVEYGPLSDPEFLLSVSPLQRVEKIQVPVFIAHGFNDPRVPVEEAMQLSMALKEAKRDPRVFIAPDEGHGFAKLDNRVYFGERVAAFLDETIGGGAAAPGGGGE